MKYAETSAQFARASRAFCDPGVRTVPTHTQESSRIGSAVSTLSEAPRRRADTRTTAVIEDSPGPAGGMSRRSGRTVSVTGVSVKHGTEDGSGYDSGQREG